MISLKCMQCSITLDYLTPKFQAFVNKVVLLVKISFMVVVKKFSKFYSYNKQDLYQFVIFIIITSIVLIRVIYSLTV